MRKIVFGLILVIVLVALPIAWNVLNRIKNFQRIETQEVKKTNDMSLLSVVQDNLEVPWALAFLPDGRLIITERLGHVLIFKKNGEISHIAKINVRAIGEGGLHGVAVDPKFNENKFIYLYYTFSAEGDSTLNRVVRYRLENNNLTQNKIIVDRIPGAPNHDGGRIKFGHDGYLYITTGDAQEPSLAQDKNSLGGKILRVTAEGKPAPDNPFGTKIYSYGHRNSQGITWDSKNRLWATEHGRSGIKSGLDEINLIEPGKNYGWPEIQGSQARAGLETPVINSGQDTWAPAGAAFYKDSIFFGGLRGQALFEYNIKTRELKTHLKGKLGRIREVIQGPDGFLYITTSNKDGRGTPSRNDDKVIRVNPSAL